MVPQILWVEVDPPNWGNSQEGEGPGGNLSGSYSLKGEQWKERAKL